MSKLPKLAIKLVTYTAATAAIERENAKKLLFKVGLFAGGMAIEELYLDKHGQLYKFTDQESLNIHIQDYLFSIALQTFGTSIFYDSYDEIINEIVSISVAYAAALPVL